MEFKTYTGNETLQEDGFQVFNSNEIPFIVGGFSTDLEKIALDCKNYPTCTVCGKYTTKTVISRDHGKNKCSKE